MAQLSPSLFGCFIMFNPYIIIFHTDANLTTYKDEETVENDEKDENHYIDPAFAWSNVIELITDLLGCPDIPKSYETICFQPLSHYYGQYLHKMIFFL